MVRPGISQLLDQDRELLGGKAIGVFTNHSGVLPDLTSSLDALLDHADVRAIFSPEHGLFGVAAEGDHVAGSMHRTGIPIHSLYGAQLAPTSDQLAGLDAIVCDIQDIGCRFYTYAWTLIKLMEVAAQHRICVIIADRPNPLGGVAIEGPGVEPEFRTLVGLYDVPIRHSLTLGELARLVNAEMELGCELIVVPCNGWKRAMLWSETGLPWVPPSPNMPTAETAILYPGTCLLEGVNVSVGRGTARPFEWIGAPWIEGDALAHTLNDQRLAGVRWRSIRFQPCSGPYASQVCQGVQPHLIEGGIAEPVAIGVALLAALRSVHPQQMAINTTGDIYADPEQMQRRMYGAQPDWNVAHFDRLAGSSSLRHALEAEQALHAITTAWQPYTEHFRTRAAPVLLYD